MSILYRSIRPLVAFDVENADHRRWYAEFVKFNTWGRCPVRFLAESLDQDLVSHINDKMLTYYIKQEFKNGKAKSKAKNSFKAKPKSTRTPRVVRGKHSVQAKSSKEQTTVSA
jgi:hypothetical protein